jgi:hypothetical protein
VVVWSQACSCCRVQVFLLEIQICERSNLIVGKKGVRPEVVVCVWRCLLQAAVAAAGIIRHKRPATMSALAQLRLWAKKLRHPTVPSFPTFLSLAHPLYSVSLLVQLFSMAAGIMRMRPCNINMCCCSGKSDYLHLRCLSSVYH